MTWLTLFLALNTEATCFRSNVVELCCPSACAIKAKRNQQAATQALHWCAASLGCRDFSWSVGMTCGCR
jgi:hypothetical protein